MWKVIGAVAHRVSMCLLVKPLASFDDSNAGFTVTVIGVHAQTLHMPGLFLLPFLGLHSPLPEAVFDHVHAFVGWQAEGHPGTERYKK